LGEKGRQAYVAGRDAADKRIQDTNASRANELPLQSKDNCVFPFVDSDAQHSKRTALPWQFAFQSRTSTDVVGEIDLVGDGALKQG
jgi:hypothetical protein